MTLFLRYSDPGGIDSPAALVSLGSNIRFGDLGLAMSAEIGTPDMSTVMVDDPGGVWNFVGLRAFDVRETACASNNTVIGRFAIQNRTIERSKDRALITQADRLWTFDLADDNWNIGKRILIDSDAKRPAETAGDRLRWLLTSAANIKFYDYGHVTYPTTPVDAQDYRGETAGTVLADCCVEDQYTFWIAHNEAHGLPELFFMDPDSTGYASTLAISNVIDDVDSTVTFAPYMDAQLVRSPERIAAGVYLAYNGGYVYTHNAATAAAYANVDRAAPMATVHTAAKATRLANKFLAVNNEEDDRITVGIKVPAAQVNDIREGHRLFVRFLHLPGYETGRWTRCLHRQVIQDEEGGGDYYRLVLELVPSGTYPPPPPGAGDYTGDVFAGLQRSDHFPPYIPPYGAPYGELGYDHNYDTDPTGGWNTIPTTGPISVDQTTLPYTSITVSQSMVVRIHAKASAGGVYFPSRSVTMYVRINGVIAGSDTHTLATGSAAFEVDLRNYHLIAGDVVSVTATPSVAWGDSGINTTYLQVGRGTFLDGGGGTIFTGP